jgi:hypothetical protein
MAFPTRFNLFQFGACLFLGLQLAACDRQGSITTPNQTLSDTQAMADRPVADDTVAAGADEMRPLAATAEESGWAATYAGKLDGKIEVDVQVHGLGDVARGTLTYKKSGKPILVLGAFHTDGTFFLREYQPDGNVTGVLSGIEKTQKLTGSWYAPGTDKEMKLELAAVTVQEEGTVAWPYAAQQVVGEYGYHYGKDGPRGSIVVKQAGDKVRFAIECVNGAPGHNMAMIEEAEAVLTGSELHYKMPEMDCEFKIQFFDGFAVVSHVDERTDCEFGNGAGIEGDFVKLK